MKFEIPVPTNFTASNFIVFCNIPNILLDMGSELRNIHPNYAL